jgi:hypothetical protein
MMNSSHTKKCIIADTIQLPSPQSLMQGRSVRSTKSLASSGISVQTPLSPIYIYLQTEVVNMALSSPRKLIDKDLEPTYRIILQHITCTSCTEFFPKP